MLQKLDKDFRALNEFLSEKNFTKLFFLTDENTHQHCLPLLLASLETDTPYEVIEIESGEESKSIGTAIQLWEILTEFRADRHSLLVNLGGGVITDLGGFAASVYKRGIPFIHIPTTLLAMCDAALGGKTGIDHWSVKNLVGTFALPKAVFLYPEFLKTLEFRELRSGFAEMLKHGLIADRCHWQELIEIETINSETLSPLIRRSMEIKNSIAAQDFQEKNIRKILNFGHTIGHAVESVFLAAGTPLAHGEAVAAGMMAEAKLAENLGLINTPEMDEVSENILKFFPVPDLSLCENSDLIRLMQNDKKNRDRRISFSLIDGIGSCRYDVTADDAQVEKALNFLRVI